MTSVALVMPVYNEADGIAEFLTEIDSVLPDIEVFVVNDCSTDSTLAERTSPSSIASSPKKSPGARVARVIALPSGYSRVTRNSPERTT